MSSRRKSEPAPILSDVQRRFAHIVYFRLVDRSTKTLELFLKLCTKYLSGHQGEEFFSLGTRASEMERDVSVQDFDVAMHIVFDSKDSYTRYSQDPRHFEFIYETAGMSSARRVFDSYLLAGPVARKRPARSGPKPED